MGPTNPAPWEVKKCAAVAFMNAFLPTTENVKGLPAVRCKDMPILWITDKIRTCHIWTMSFTTSIPSTKIARPITDCEIIINFRRSSLSDISPQKGFNIKFDAAPNAGARPTINGDAVNSHRSQPWPIINGWNPAAPAKLLSHIQRNAGILKARIKRSQFTIRR